MVYFFLSSTLVVYLNTRNTYIKQIMDKFRATVAPIVHALKEILQICPTLKVRLDLFHLSKYRDLNIDTIFMKISLTQ